MALGFIRVRLVGVWLAAALVSRLCGTEPLNEYQVKAAFLYNFARFVEWPAESFRSPSAPLTICVLGEDPFGPFLDQTIGGKTVEGRRLTAPRIADIRSANGCQILFLSASERNRMPALLASVGAAGVLTVADTPDFASFGGVIGFRIETEHIRLQVNLAAAEKARLKISSRLLSLAEIVKR